MASSLKTESRVVTPSTPTLSPAGILESLLWISLGIRLAEAFYVI